MSDQTALIPTPNFIVKVTANLVDGIDDEIKSMDEVLQVTNAKSPNQ